MRHWLVWREEDFPRTSTQKPRRNLIQQAVVAQQTQKSDDPKSTSVLGDLIGRIKGNPSTQLSASSNLENDLNLSSLERVELLGALEDRYQLDLSEANFASVQTVGDLENLLHGERSNIKPNITTRVGHFAGHSPGSESSANTY